MGDGIKHAETHIKAAFERVRTHHRGRTIQATVKMVRRKSLAELAGPIIQRTHGLRMHKKQPMVYMIEEDALPRGPIEKLFDECMRALFPPKVIREPKKASILHTRIF